MFVASAVTDKRGEGLVEQATGHDLADDLDHDLDRDALAAANQDQVDVLDGAADRVTLDRLGQGELAAPSAS